MGKSTRKRSSSTIRQLRDLGLPADYPLSPHAGSNQFYKTHKGRRYYYGSMSDPDAALALFNEEWPHILADEPIPDPEPIDPDAETVATVIDRWLKRQHVRMNAHKIRPRTYEDYRQVTNFMRQHLGDATRIDDLRPLVWTDLRDAIDTLTKSPTVQSRYVTICRMPFKWAWEAEVVDTAIRFGPDFKVAPKKEVRKARNLVTRRTFSAAEVRQIIDAAPVYLRAMVLLGINGGFTQAEVAGLRLDDIDLRGAIIDTVRAKTGCRRTVPLWPETVKALRLAIKRRRKPKAEDDKRLAFITRHGMAYVRSAESVSGAVVNRDNVAREFKKSLTSAGVKVPDGMGFGKLRHTFRTAADPTRDIHAIRRCMGHEVGDGAEATYIEDIEHDRLRAVTDAVRAWVFNGEKQ